MQRIRFNGLDKQLTPDEMQEIETAAAMPVAFDEDSPEMTPKMLMQFKRMSREGRNK